MFFFSCLVFVYAPYSVALSVGCLSSFCVCTVVVALGVFLFLSNFCLCTVVVALGVFLFLSSFCLCTVVVALGVFVFFESLAFFKSHHLLKRHLRC